MEHTKEPWSLGKWVDDQERYIDAVNGDKDLNFTKWEGLAVVFGSDDFSGGNEKCEANSRRIVACVNACKGIDTELLEIAGSMAGPAMDILEGCRKAEAQRDAALAMVREWSSVFTGMMESMKTNDVEKMSWFMERGIDALTKAEAING